MKFIVDVREGERIARIAEEICDTELRVLPLGDILLVLNGEAVAFERKTPHDFVSSIRSNRLWEQLLKFMKTDEILGFKIKRRILVIHGVLRDYSILENEGKFWSSIMGALLEILFVYDTPIIVAENDLALEALLRVEMRREMEGANDGPPDARWFRGWRKEGLPQKDLRKYALTSIPLIGEKNAEALLRHFGSIQRIANASVGELMRVRGIGRKRAENIYNLFH